MAEKVLHNWFVDYCYAECHCAISVVMLLSDAKNMKVLNAIMLSLVLLIVVMLSISVQCQYTAESQLC